MKSRIALITIAVALCPARAFAAPAQEPAASWFSLIFYACNFALFVWLIRRYAGPMITGFFRDRARTIRQTMTHAETAYKEAQQLAERAAEQMVQLESERERLAAELEEETVYLVNRVRDGARETIGRLRRDTELTTAALRDGAQRRLRRAMAEAAGQLARELLSRAFQPSDQDRLLEGFIERIGEEVRP